MKPDRYEAIKQGGLPMRRHLKQLPLKVYSDHVVQQSKSANIRVNWTGRYLLQGSEGTAYPSEGRIGMLPLGRYGGLGKDAETLMQELCHMLGVAHSEVRMDIMFGEGHSRSPELSKLSVTARDKQMLAWLYSLTRYVDLGE